MNIDYLKEFSHLAKSLNFRKTADYFYVSPSVISRHIAALEEELGVRLFHRRSGKVHLTHAGEIFLKDALIIVSDYANAVERLVAADSEGEAIVRLGYLHNAARPFMVEFLNYMEKHHQDVNLLLCGLKFKDLYTALDDHKVDINFMMDVSGLKKNCYDHRLIYTDRLFAVMGPGNPLANCSEGIHLEELSDQKLIVPDPQAYPGFEKIIGRLLALISNPRPKKYYNDIDSLYLQIETESGVGFSSGFNRILYKDKFVFVPILDVDTHIDVIALWRNTLFGPTLNSILDALNHIQVRVPA